MLQTQCVVLHKVLKFTQRVRIREDASSDAVGLCLLLV